MDEQDVRRIVQEELAKLTRVKRASKAGAARASKLTPEQRKAISQKAAARSAEVRAARKLAKRMPTDEELLAKVEAIRAKLRRGGAGE